MCGIFGYVGEPRAARFLVDGIRRLEYRGYDSAGVTYLTEGGASLIPKIIKGAGFVDAVMTPHLGVLQADTMSVGIAHTRWATHGKPVQVNAHPHEFPNFYLIHNGIIENYEALIEKYGITERVSETDSEVVGWVLEALIKQALAADIRTLIHSLHEELRGSYACLFMFKRERKLMAIRRKSPLNIGVEDRTGNVLVCSDQTGFGDFTGKVYQLHDGDSLIVEKGCGPVLFDGKGMKTPVFKSVELKAPELQDRSKCYFLKEIYDQERVFDPTLLSVHRRQIRETLNTLGPPKDVQIVACGSAYHAGLYGKMILDQLGKFKTEAHVSSEFRYRNIPVRPGEWHVFISQSGETADTLESARISRGQKKAGLVSITTHEENSLSRITQNNWPMKCGTEVSVAATKTFIAQLKMFALLTGELSANAQVPSEDCFTAFFAALPEIQKHIQPFAKTAAGLKTLVYLGKDLLLPIAMEGALKIKEICYVHAEAFASGELKHGPLALIDENTLSISCISKDFYPEKGLNALHEVQSRNGKILIITDDEKIYKHHKDESIWIDHQFPYAWAGIPFVIPLQLFAYEVAKLKGVNIDRPRNLAKSVTVE